MILDLRRRYPPQGRSAAETAVINPSTVIIPDSDFATAFMPGAFEISIAGGAGFATSLTLDYYDIFSFEGDIIYQGENSETWFSEIFYE